MQVLTGPAVKHITVSAYSRKMKICVYDLCYGLQRYCKVLLTVLSGNVSVHVACTGTARLEPRIPLMTLWWDEFLVMDVCDHGVVFADVIVGSKHP